MSLHFIFFLIINIYFIWWMVSLVRKRKQRSGGRKKKPFIVLIDDETEVPAQKVPETPRVQSPKEDEWLKRVRAEIEDMTK